MATSLQWVYSDVVSGESAAEPCLGSGMPGQPIQSGALPEGWAIVDGECHGPRGLYIIAQRMILQVVTGNATHAEAATTPYDPSSTLDSGYTIPAGL